MGTICDKYTFEQINLFVDKELPQDRMDTMSEHCRQCPDCQKTIEKLTTISNTFKMHVERKTAAMDKTVHETTIAASKMLEKQGKIFSNVFGLLGRHLYLKLGFITAIVLIGVFMLNSTFMAPGGPSAIVKYVDTEMPSVMIIETEKQKHTIIWISET